MSVLIKTDQGRQCSREDVSKFVVPLQERTFFEPLPHGRFCKFYVMLDKNSQQSQSFFFNNSGNLSQPRPVGFGKLNLYGCQLHSFFFCLTEYSQPFLFLDQMKNVSLHNIYTMFFHGYTNVTKLETEEIQHSHAFEYIVLHVLLCKMSRQRIQIHTRYKLSLSLSR